MKLKQCCFTEKKPWSRDTIIDTHGIYEFKYTIGVIELQKKNKTKQKREDKESETGVTRVEGARIAWLM